MRLTWDRVGNRLYETGVDRGVLYPATGSGYGNGIPWNGLTAVNENPTGAESSKQYADNIPYLNLVSAEQFGATIEAFTYPPEFAECDGSVQVANGIMIGQQTRKTFGFAYRTKVGNDLVGQDFGYKLHLVYGCTAAPSAKNYGTVNESPEAINFSWEVTTTPVDVPGYKPTATFTIDSTLCSPSALKKLEDIIYGSETTEARLPMPKEIIEIGLTPDAVTITLSLPSGSDDLLGQTVDALESNLVFRDKAISGTLHYVKNYTGFSSEPSQQSGNFIAVKVATDPTADSITMELVGGSGTGPKALDSTGVVIARITNKDAQSMKFVATKGADTVTKIYALNELVCETSVG